jgi:NAD(P)-dependent dehydrogenase (short-subunit alcohol dehydrogenase family)
MLTGQTNHSPDMETKWTTDQIPSQTGKIVLVTGANSGLGFYSAKALAEKGAFVIMAVRNLNLGKVAQQKITEACPDAKTEVLPLDLADLESIRQFARIVGDKHKKLDILINNAGVMFPPHREETRQGFELQFGVNHIGHFALTAQLFDLMKASGNSRIVTVSSLVGKLKMAAIHWDDLQWKKEYRKNSAYAQSKLANLMFTLELQERLDKNLIPVKSVAAHPGYSSTNLQRHLRLAGKIGNFLLAQKAEIGMLPSLRAATDPAVKGGDYYGPIKMMGMFGYPQLCEYNPKALKKEERQKLWKISEELTGEKFL